MHRFFPCLLCLLATSCVLPSWPPPWATDDDDILDDDTVGDDDTAGDDDTLGSWNEWITIEGGDFEMGSENGETDELPVHHVTVQTFEMMRTEVTISHYAACVGTDACSETEGDHENCGAVPFDYGDQPVGCANWDQATEFCAWAGGRLPTEAEWEFAARNRGQAVEFPWGDDEATCELAIMHDTNYGAGGCGLDSVWNVCSRSPDGDTEQGLCDMAGNVVEWNQDWYHVNYEDAPDDGSSWESGGGGGRVSRGGACGNGSDNLRAAARSPSPPDTQAGSIGIRCARGHERG